MKTDVPYLRQLGEDLTLAAQRETLHAARRRLRLPPGKTVFAVATFAVVTGAGVLGYFVTTLGGTRIERSFGYTPTGQGPKQYVQARAFTPPQHLASPPASGVTLVPPRVIKTANLSLVLKKNDFDRAFQEASMVANNYGGFVSASSRQGSKSMSGNVELRVPARSFDLALRDLRSLGRVERDSVSGQDVTAQYVDLKARIVTWKAQERVLLRLMSTAESVEDTLRVQGELQDVQLRIEELKGQLRVLGDRVAMGTIAVALREAGVPAARPAGTETRRPSLAGGWHRGVNGFFGVLVAMVVGLGYLLPITALVVLVGLVAWVAIRRGRSAQAA
jgi:hypothetical protein